MGCIQEARNGERYMPTFACVGTVSVRSITVCVGGLSLNS
jgi:hypothetical protein